MKPLKQQPSLTEQVYEAIVERICDGGFPAGSHLVQEQLADTLGVSRQPVQQAMALLKADGMVEEQGKRGLWVTGLDPELMAHHYEIRAVLDGLAARMTALRVAEKPGVAETFERRAGKILKRGRKAVKTGDVAGQVRHDMAFHALFYEMSGNPLLARTAEPHWCFLRRAMGEVMRRTALSQDIWRQHAEITEAVQAGDPDLAEARMTAHVSEAAGALYTSLDAQARAGKPSKRAAR